MRPKAEALGYLEARSQKPKLEAKASSQKPKAKAKSQKPKSQKAKKLKS
jgi:hypothetical protein